MNKIVFNVIPQITGSVCKNRWSYAHTEIKPERRSSLKQYEMAIAGNYCPHCGTLYETLEEINQVTYQKSNQR